MNQLEIFNRAKVANIILPIPLKVYINNVGSVSLHVLAGLLLKITVRNL